MEHLQTAGPDFTGSLRCTLLDRRSSVPLQGARITCIGRDNRITRFDADRFGRFDTTLPQGTYDLVVSAGGYLSLLVRGVGVLAGHHHSITRALVPGEGSGADVAAATALGGYICDRFGRPVGNVTIHLAAGGGDKTHTTRTERDGAYLLHGIVPDVYDLTICALERRLVREYVPIANPKEFIRIDLRLMQM
jgi:hypothetical protein